VNCYNLHNLAEFTLTRSTGLRLFAFAACYFAQGVPIGLFIIALPAWLAEQGANAADIASLVAITGLPWAFKLIAGPFMDRFTFPAMGRRRPWLMGAQLGLTLSLLGLLAVTDPLAQLWLIVSVGFVSSVFGALQDVAVDGMAIDVLPEGERGRANAFMAAGQVAGYSAFAAINGYLLTHHGLALAAVSSTLTVGLVLILVTLLRERPGERMLPWTPGAASSRAGALERSLGQIMRDLLRVVFLPMSLLLVGIEFLSRAAGGVGLTIFPILAVQELGYSTEQYGSWMGIVGGIAAFAGLLFGPFIDRYGAKPLLLAGLGGGAAVHLAFALANAHWQNDAFVLSMLGFGQIFGQIFFVAVIATFMGLCWIKVAATQFAVYMSLANLSRSVGAALFALIAADVSSTQALYIIAGLLLLAALLLLLFDPEQHHRHMRNIK
jgi:PAT family beta-lactamase induction signal transducer AmpG